MTIEVADTAAAKAFYSAAFEAGSGVRVIGISWVVLRSAETARARPSRLRG
jgi:hypothetical protein